jgi:hypothetical protein
MVGESSSVARQEEAVGRPQNSIPKQDAIPVLTYVVSLSLKCAMTILSGTRRYIFFVSVFILILQAAVVARQNRQSGVTVSYESLGNSRIARFTNSNSFPVRVEFLYQGTKVHGSSEASGEDAVFVAANFSATYGGAGLSITSVRITGVMRSD